MKLVLYLSTFLTCFAIMQAQTDKFLVEAASIKAYGKEERSSPTNLYIYLDYYARALRLSNGTFFQMKNFKPKNLGRGLVGWDAYTKDDNGIKTQVMAIELEYPNSGRWTLIFTNSKYRIIYVLTELR